MYWFTKIWQCFFLSMVYDGFAFVPWNWFQVHIEFRRQCLEMTVDKLLEQFVLNKYTGLEKPGKCIFLFYVSFFLYHLDLLVPDHNCLLTLSDPTSDLVWQYDLYHLDLLVPDYNCLLTLSDPTSDLVWQYDLYHLDLLVPDHNCLLTLSDPISDIVRQYYFPVLLRCQKTSDMVFVAFVRPLSEPVRCFSSCSTDFSQQIAQVVLFLFLHVFLF
jgi:hypothetical protein